MPEAAEPETEALPRLTLWVWKYWHPVYKNTVTLDCSAVSREAALKSAQRFLRRQNRRMARARIKLRFQLPYHVNCMVLG